jgi:hypothetical protein
MEIISIKNFIFIFPLLWGERLGRWVETLRSLLGLGRNQRPNFNGLLSLEQMYKKNCLFMQLRYSYSLLSGFLMGRVMAPK